MKMLKKMVSFLLVGATTFSFAACGSNATGANTQQPQQSQGQEGSSSPTNAEATKLELWTFNELHQTFYEYMADKWNQEHPDEQIDLVASTLPYDDMHNKLLIALQSGVGAPDISDIELGKFANFLKGTPQLLPLDDIIEPELPNIVKARVDIYAKDDHYYGICFHVGAAVMYYNTEILNAAGVDYTKIETVDDYLAAAQKVKEATGKPMATVETLDPWHIWPFIASQGGDLLDENGKPNIDSAPDIKALEMEQQMIKEGWAVVAPGGGHHAEEYYGSMNQGEYASVSMPLWYMGRFTDYMPDLQGKIAIAPVPVFKKGDPRSVGLGGTGTAITNQTKNEALAKKFVAYAKLSKEGNIEIWNQLGFDPIRTEVWDLPEVHDSKNKFTDYFQNNPFDILMEVKNEILPIHVSEYLPPTMDAIRSSVLARIYDGLENPTTVVQEEQPKIKIQ